MDNGDTTAAEPITIRKYNPPEQGALQPDSRGICAVGGAGPDKRIDEIIYNLRAIRATPPFEPAVMPDSVIKELSETVRHISSIAKGRTSVEEGAVQKAVSYPDSGRTTIGIGVTKINIRSGQIIHTDGSKDVLYGSSNMNTARSFIMYTDCSVDVVLSLKGTIVQRTTCFPSWNRFKPEFDLIEITATKHTSFYIQLSANRDGVTSMARATYYEGNPYVSSTSVAVAGTKNTEEIYAELGKNGREGVLRHNDETGVLYVEISHDGVDYADIIPLGVGDTIEFDGDDLHTILIDADTDDTAYVLVISPEV